MMFFFGIDRLDICEEGTMLLNWKRAKHIIGKTVTQMMNHNYIGPQVEPVLAYKSLNYVDALLEGISLEELQDISPGFTRLFKFLTQSIQLRKSDIIRRRVIVIRHR